MWLRTVAHKGYISSALPVQTLAGFCFSACAFFYLNLLPIKKGFCGCHKCPLRQITPHLITLWHQLNRKAMPVLAWHHRCPVIHWKKGLISFHRRKRAVALKPNNCAIQKMSLEADGKHTTVFYDAGMKNTVLLSSTVSGVVHSMKTVSVFASPVASLCKLCFLPRGHYDLLILGKICLTKYYKTS